MTRGTWMSLAILLSSSVDCAHSKLLARPTTYFLRTVRLSNFHPQYLALVSLVLYFLFLLYSISSHFEASPHLGKVPGHISTDSYTRHPTSETLCSTYIHS